MLSTSKHGLLSRLRGLQVQIQRLNFTLAEVEFEAQLGPEIVPHSEAPQVKIDMSKWKTVDSRSIGITCSMVPDAPYTVLKILHSAGFQGYLVGGCVRDLLLNKPPKDYDIITTATLDEIKAKFHFCGIVGKQFPICKVHVKGSVIEVSSFETVAQHAKKKEKDLLSQTPSHCSERDFLRWRNSMHRDFTINSLFFDPFVYEIYDYANGIADLKALELRTIIPAQLSFTEDCARILRGLRIAARLGLSIPKETDTAIHKLSSSISRLDKFRMMLELNYMLSYGAASCSLHLLWKYKLLKILLPFQAAYLDEKTSKKCAHHSTMLMKLFSNLDKLVTCDKPADCSLWVGLLAFHLALVNNPQDARVVRAFASVLHHGNWKEGVKSAREHDQVRKEFVPEISELSDLESDEELAKRVSKFASLVQLSIASLADENSLLQSMSRYPGFQCSGVVFVPRKVYNQVYDMFEVLTVDIENYDNGRERFDINYYLLGKGNMLETRFVLGKVILKTMNEGVTRKKKDHLQVHKKVEDDLPPLSDSVNEEMNFNNDRKRRLSLLIPAPELRTMRKQKVVEMNSSILKQLEVEIGNGNSQDTVKFPSLLSKRQPIFFDLNKEPIRLATAETTKHEKQVERVSKKESRKPSQVNGKRDESQDEPTGFASKETRKKQRPVHVSVEKRGKSQDERTGFARKETRKKQGPVSVSNEKQIASKETKKKQGPVLVSKEKQNRRPVKKESGLPLLSSLFK